MIGTTLVNAIAIALVLVLGLGCVVIDCLVQVIRLSRDNGQPVSRKEREE